MKQLHVEFMSTSGMRSGYASAVQKKRKDTGLFWWSVLITLLLGVATFSWFFSIYVFAHPEKPFNYKLLTKFEKIEPPQQFSPLSVPSGQFLAPEEIYAKYYTLTDDHLRVDNAMLKRRYLTNYTEAAPIYLKGLFRIYQVRRLTERDVFPSGIVVRARSHDYPMVVIEYLFPSEEVPADPQAIFALGDDLSLDRTSTFASVLHIEKLREQNLCFTLVPLVYGTYEVAEVGRISLSPPDKLNLEGGFPITDEEITPAPDRATVEVDSAPGAEVAANAG